MWWNRGEMRPDRMLRSNGSASVCSPCHSDEAVTGTYVGYPVGDGWGGESHRVFGCNSALSPVPPPLPTRR